MGNSVSTSALHPGLGPPSLSGILPGVSPLLGPAPALFPAPQYQNPPSGEFQTTLGKASLTPGGSQNSPPRLLKPPGEGPKASLSQGLDDSRVVAPRRELVCDLVLQLRVSLGYPLHHRMQPPNPSSHPWGLNGLRWRRESSGPTSSGTPVLLTPDLLLQGGCLLAGFPCRLSCGVRG